MERQESCTRGDAMKIIKENVANVHALDRRGFLHAAAGACAIAPLTPLYFQLASKTNGSLTKEERDRMTPAEVIEELKKGNERFRSGKMLKRAYLAKQKTS